MIAKRVCDTGEDSLRAILEFCCRSQCDGFCLCLTHQCPPLHRLVVQSGDATNLDLALEVLLLVEGRVKSNTDFVSARREASCCLGESPVG